MRPRILFRGGIFPVVHGKTQNASHRDCKNVQGELMKRAAPAECKSWRDYDLFREHRVAVRECSADGSCAADGNLRRSEIARRALAARVCDILGHRAHSHELRVETVDECRMAPSTGVQIGWRGGQSTENPLTDPKPIREDAQVVFFGWMVCTPFERTPGGLG
jgi:hypothetical protein